MSLRLRTRSGRAGLSCALGTTTLLVCLSSAGALAAPVDRAAASAARDESETDSETEADDELPAPSPAAEVDRTVSRPFTQLRLVGLERTRRRTIERLLPRPMPTALTAIEIEEFERRVRNLAVFDKVTVQADDPELVVTVREKFTLIPSLEFSTGATAVDTYALVGATESNLLGTASTLAAFLSWEERGLNGTVQFYQHPYARGRWSVDLSAYLTTADFRFADGQTDPEAADTAWLRRQAGMDLLVNGPFSYEGPVRVTFGAFGVREWVSSAEVSRVPSTGFWIGAAVVVEVDKFTFHDLVPSGWRSTLELYPGVLLPSLEARPELAWTTTFAAPVWRQGVLMGRLKAAGVGGGNANHSVLLGSLEGVRGLPDAFFRNRTQAFFNLEFRQSVNVARRWALQGVVLLDTALHEPMDATGRSQPWRQAAAAGIGLRVVPLALAGFVLRLDLARPWSSPEPSQGWFGQLAFNQYF